VLERASTLDIAFLAGGGHFLDIFAALHANPRFLSPAKGGMAI
jgi:hypothetical protein